MISMGKRIIGARLAAGYDNAASFARHCGLTKQYLKNLESGLSKAPNPAHLVKISRALNVSMEWLVTGLGSPGRNVPGPDAATPAHAELLRNFDRLTQQEKARVLTWVRQHAEGDPL